LDLPGERPAGAVVVEIGIDSRSPDDRRAIPPDVKNGRHRLPRNEIDGEDAHGVAVRHGQGSIRSAEIKTEAHGRGSVERGQGWPAEGRRTAGGRPTCRGPGGTRRGP